MVGFSVVNEPKVSPHEVSMDLAELAEKLDALEKDAIEHDVLDEEDASLVRTAWEMFVRTFVYMYMPVDKPEL